MRNIIGKFIEEIKAMDTDKEVFIAIEDSIGDISCYPIDKFMVREGRVGIYITNWREN
jgi:hypothetical protein